jgi:hypothetical protein
MSPFGSFRQPQGRARANDHAGPSSAAGDERGRLSIRLNKPTPLSTQIVPTASGQPYGSPSTMIATPIVTTRLIVETMAVPCEPILAVPADMRKAGTTVAKIASAKINAHAPRGGTSAAAECVRKNPSNAVTPAVLMAMAVNKLAPQRRSSR